MTEGIARIARVVAAGGSKYAALVSQLGPADAGREQEQITAMIDGLLRRGIDDGTFRGDITAGELRLLLGSLLQAAARMTAEHRRRRESRRAHHHSVPVRHRNREDPVNKTRPSAAARDRTRQHGDAEDGRSEQARRP